MKNKKSEKKNFGRKHKTSRPADGMPIISFMMVLAWVWVYVVAPNTLITRNYGYFSVLRLLSFQSAEYRKQELANLLTEHAELVQVVTSMEEEERVVMTSSPDKENEQFAEVSSSSDIQQMSNGNH